MCFLSQWSTPLLGIWSALQARGDGKERPTMVVFYMKSNLWYNHACTLKLYQSKWALPFPFDAKTICFRFSVACHCIKIIPRAASEQSKRTSIVLLVYVCESTKGSSMQSLKSLKEPIYFYMGRIVDRQYRTAKCVSCLWWLFQV